MSDGLRSAFDWIGQGFGKGQGIGGPWDLSDPDDTQEIEIDEDWWKDLKRDLDELDRKQIRSKCECGAWATSFRNHHADWCPLYVKP